LHKTDKNFDLTENLLYYIDYGLISTKWV